MKYLMYFCDGFVKKFPLKKKNVSIGWNKDNDLSIDCELLSGFHLRAEVGSDNILISDLDSTNGTFYSGGRVKQSVIRMGESFTAGGIDFILKEGSLEEFKASEELIPIFHSMKEESRRILKKRKTRYIKNVYEEILKQILKKGPGKSSLNELLPEVSNYLSNISDLGNIFIVSRVNGENHFLLSIKCRKADLKRAEWIASSEKDIFRVEIAGGGGHRREDEFYSFPFSLRETPSALIYFPINRNAAGKKQLDFLRTLTKEIELISRMIDDRSPLAGKEEAMIRNGNIIGGSAVIRNLIKQTEKVAKSGLFILIQGESGVGKELFARLIHDRSDRSRGKFVALNCAAIPENLLEAEFFGYEKGAFTGAYSTRKGKLELACGGTLVLDEIGDMPPSLQARLLRALQENEFYRVGGTVPVRVNLRIISLTNRNLKDLIHSGGFRDDLYYRLVHHTINIPPLRDRREDISILINYFAGEFSRAAGKNIRGFSVKAQKVLLGYDWPGNIRQLKNEVNRIINLTDTNELISYDILSGDIREWYENPGSDTVPEKEIKAENEVERIIRILKENNGNKTHAARELGMTYRGLHKKMKRLGIGNEGKEG